MYYLHTLRVLSEPNSTWWGVQGEALQHVMYACCFVYLGRTTDVLLSNLYLHTLTSYLRQVDTSTFMMQIIGLHSSSLSQSFGCFIWFRYSNKICPSGWTSHRFQGHFNAVSGHGLDLIGYTSQDTCWIKHWIYYSLDVPQENFLLDTSADICYPTTND
jgi:hypothetical protein